MKFNPVEFVEIYEPVSIKRPEDKNRFNLREVIINSDRVTYIRENKAYQDLVSHVALGLNEEHNFSVLYLADGSMMTVVGSPTVVAEKLNGRQTL